MCVCVCVCVCVCWWNSKHKRGTGQVLLRISFVLRSVHTGCLETALRCCSFSVPRSPGMILIFGEPAWYARGFRFFVGRVVVLSLFHPCAPFASALASASSTALPLNEIINWLSFGHPALDGIFEGCRVRRIVAVPGMAATWMKGNGGELWLSTQSFRVCCEDCFYFNLVCQCDNKYFFFVSEYKKNNKSSS